MWIITFFFLSSFKPYYFVSMCISYKICETISQSTCRRVCSFTDWIHLSFHRTNLYPYVIEWFVTNIILVVLLLLLFPTVWWQSCYYSIFVRALVSFHNIHSLLGSFLSPDTFNRYYTQYGCPLHPVQSPRSVC